MNITHDLIAAVTGPGWKYGLSRLLINDQGEGVVFIAGSTSPFAYFTVADVRASRGSGTTDEGGTITWRRRGSSCQYKLAKCKIDTATLEQRWTNSLAPVEEPAVEEPAEEPAEEPVDENVVPDGSASEVMSWVGEDFSRAQNALDAENDGKQRVGLTSDLEKMLAAEELL